MGGTATVIWTNRPEETLQAGTAHAWGRRMSYSLKVTCNMGRGAIFSSGG